MLITMYDTDPESTVEVPSRFEVCPRCKGEGAHDCWEGGIKGDELSQQSPDFFDDYMAGVYSISCTRCGGLRVVEVVDRARVPAPLLARIDGQAREVDAMLELEALERSRGA